MGGIDRRDVLRLGLLGSVTLWSGCSGGGESAQAEGPPAENPPPWNIAGLSLMEDSGQSLDLTETLPLGVRRGGVFSVHASGAPLPAGMNLSAAGILAVGKARVGETKGVVFAYAEPGD